MTVALSLAAAVAPSTSDVLVLGSLTGEAGAEETTRELTHEDTNGTTSTDGKTLQNVKDGFSIAQAVVTILGIVFGALWAYAVFYHAGNNATSVQIQTELKQAVDRVDPNGVVVGKGALVSVTLKNIGRVRVDRNPLRGCKISSASITNDEMLNLVKVGSADLAAPITNALPPRRARVDTVFRTLKGLEPDEEATEDVLFLLEENTPSFKVAVQFDGIIGPGPIRSLLIRWSLLNPLSDEQKEKRTWAARAMFDVRTIEVEASTRAGGS